MKNIRLLTTFDSSATEVYGSWAVTLRGETYKVGMSVGVPRAQLGSYTAAGAGVRPFSSAWYEDGSDADEVTPEIAAEILDLAREHAAALCAEVGL